MQVSPDLAARTCERHRHRQRRRHVLRAGLALGAAGAAVAAAVITAVAHGPVTKATPIAAPALRTRLLAAIDTHDYINIYTANLDQGGLQLSGTAMWVNHFRHVWSECHAKFILGFTLDAAGIRAEIANGQFTVIGRTELDRQQAIELKINVPPSNEAPPHTTAARLWVNATSYLPMQEYTRMSNGRQSVFDYVFLPPTPENLAKLLPVIPAGYTRAGCAQASGPKPHTRGFSPPS
jgi:hypothetical protein